MRLGLRKLNSERKTKYQFAPGQKLGRWTVATGEPTYRPAKSDGYAVAHFEVVCACGTKKFLTGNVLSKGMSQSCGCVWKERVLKANPSFKGLEEISGKYFGRVRRVAEKREIPFDLSLEDFWDSFKRQNGTCALSGVPIQMGWATREETASLDRINSGLGYSVDNIQWVHKHLNHMKNMYPQDYFIEMCGSVYLKHKGNHAI